MDVITREQLAERDGKDGWPAWVAFEGKVYDVTALKLWKHGGHMRRHDAGADLTASMPDAPHDGAVFEKAVLVGELAEQVGGAAEPEEKEATGPVDRLLAAFPFFRRHPHPLAVHFPVALVFTATGLSILYLIAPWSEIAVTARVTYFLGLLSAFPAMITGLASWWLVYGMAPMWHARWKIALSLALSTAGVAVGAWWWFEPALLTDPGAKRVGLIGALCAMSLILSVLGYIGAMLTIKD